jgi:hypothetical protein
MDAHKLLISLLHNPCNKQLKSQIYVRMCKLQAYMRNPCVANHGSGKQTCVMPTCTCSRWMLQTTSVCCISLCIPGGEWMHIQASMHLYSDAYTGHAAHECALQVLTRLSLLSERPWSMQSLLCEHSCTATWQTVIIYVFGIFRMVSVTKRAPTPRRARSACVYRLAHKGAHVTQTNRRNPLDRQKYV